jgi:plastocyanin
VDRVGFPEGYATDYVRMFVLDRPDNRQVRVIYGNQAAVSVKYGEPLPYGSILVMETWSSKRDAAGNAEMDASGRFVPDALTGIFVQRKEQGFGEAYQVQRSGEWEYVAFRPDKSYSQPPENTNACAACHQDAGKTRDFLFRTDLYYFQKSGAVPQAVVGMAALGRVPIQNYSFVPGDATVKAGTLVTWINEDEAVHTITAADNSWDSGRVSLGASYSRMFEQPGVYEYFCSLHQNMKARLIVE